MGKISSSHALEALNATQFRAGHLTGISPPALATPLAREAPSAPQAETEPPANASRTVVRVDSAESAAADAQRDDGCVVIQLRSDEAAPSRTRRVKNTSQRQRKLRLDPAETAWLQRQQSEGLVEQRQIAGRRFSDELAPWITAYESIGQRGGYIWKWCLHGVELTTLSCVPETLRGDACDTKVLAGVFNVLVDDVADQQGNGDLLTALRKMVHGGEVSFASFAAYERRYGEFTRQVWDEIWRRAKRYPCYNRYAGLLEFDLAQLFNTVHYSHLVNSNPYILNVVEHDDYSPQGMGLLSFAMIDLMCSPRFIAGELGKLREAMWHAQWMARIGNLITTWHREVADRDYSSGVFAHAVARRDLTIDQLVAGNSAQITAAIEDGGHEAYFLRRWKKHRANVQRLLDEVQSVDLQAMVRGLERLLQTELVSRGHK